MKADLSVAEGDGVSLVRFSAKQFRFKNVRKLGPKCLVKLMGEEKATKGLIVLLNPVLNGCWTLRFRIFFTALV